VVPYVEQQRSKNDICGHGAYYRTIMRCSTVQISASGIYQLEGGRITATVSKEDIRRIKLSYDSLARHPFLQFFAGFGLIVTGLVLIIATFMMADVGAFLYHLTSNTYSIPVAPIVLWFMVGAGLWLLVRVFRGRYNLLISTAQGSRKIFFGGATDINDILRVIGRANRELGYNIDLSITETMYIPDASADDSANNINSIR
jgi:hypothetical protein